MLRKLLLLALVPLALTSCKKEGVETHKEGNFQLTLLFEIDGCKQYRFTDGGYVYTMVCPGGSSATTANKIKNRQGTGY